MSFKQYEKCNFCRRSHNKSGKHSYSKIHREVVVSALGKFKRKIEEASEELFKSPVIKTVIRQNLETMLEKRFWCWFCDNEFQLNEKIDDCFVEKFLLVGHLKSLDHKKNVMNFWTENGFVKNHFEMSHFIILDEVFNRLETHLSKLITSFNQQNEQNLMENKEQLKCKEQISEVAMNTAFQFSSNLASSGSCMPATCQGEAQREHKRHTVVNDYGGSVSSVIGPTKEDQLEHKQLLTRLSTRTKAKIIPNMSSLQSTTLHSKVFLPYQVRRNLNKNKSSKHIPSDLRAKYMDQKYLPPSVTPSETSLSFHPPPLPSPLSPTSLSSSSSHFSMLHQNSQHHTTFDISQDNEDGYGISINNTREYNNNNYHNTSYTVSHYNENNSFSNNNNCSIHYDGVYNGNLNMKNNKNENKADVSKSCAHCSKGRTKTYTGAIHKPVKPYVSKRKKSST